MWAQEGGFVMRACIQKRPEGSSYLILSYRSISEKVITIYGSTPDYVLS